MLARTYTKTILLPSYTRFKQCSDQGSSHNSDHFRSCISVNDAEHGGAYIRVYFRHAELYTDATMEIVSIDMLSPTI